MNGGYFIKHLLKYFKSKGGGAVVSCNTSQECCVSFIFDFIFCL